MLCISSLASYDIVPSCCIMCERSCTLWLYMNADQVRRHLLHLQECATHILLWVGTFSSDMG